MGLRPETMATRRYAWNAWIVQEFSDSAQFLGRRKSRVEELDVCVGWLTVIGCLYQCPVALSYVTVHRQGHVYYMI